MLAVAGLSLIASSCATEPQDTGVIGPPPSETAGLTLEPSRTATLEASPTPSPDALMRQRVEQALQGERLTLAGALVEYVARFPGDLLYATLAQNTGEDIESYALIKNFDCAFRILAAVGQLGEEEEIEFTSGRRISPTVFRLWRPQVRIDELDVSVSLGVPTVLTVESVSYHDQSAVCPEEPFLDLPGAREIGRRLSAIFWEFVEGVEEGRNQ